MLNIGTFQVPNKTSADWLAVVRYPAGIGLPTEAGYTVRKDDPSSRQRQAIRDDVPQGDINLPDWMTSTIQEQ